jgi:hypothetical protein
MDRLTIPVSNRTRFAEDAPVAWTGGPPADEDALAVWQAITDDRVATYGAVVQRAGERLFRRDLERLGAAADIGFFQSFYRAHARDLVAALAGTVLRIGGGA